MRPYDPSQSIYLQYNQGNGQYNPVDCTKPCHSLEGALTKLKQACATCKPDRLPRLVQNNETGFPEEITLPEPQDVV